MKNPPKALLAHRSITKQIDWDSVYKSELPRIYNFFLYKVGNQESAQDLTATTFERAWQLRSRYRATIAALSTWLFGIARNVLKENIRKDRMDERKVEAISRSEDMEANVDIERLILHQQEKEFLRNILLELPYREQDLIALKYGAGLTNREIAKITSLSKSNVVSILNRTVKNIRIQLEEYHGR